MRISASFRDPSGFLFSRNGLLFRQVNRAYAEDYDRLMRSGLYDALVGEGLMVPHREVADVPAADPAAACKVIQPLRVPFISYPYEWSFSQLRDAARVTLSVQGRALDHGMTLKDASAYNIQFVDGRPVLIDTLSFEGYREGEPWSAYRQFCQHFLAPLALMSYVDVRLSQLLRVWLDGIPLNLASALLPLRTHLRFPLLAHLHLHARAQKKYAGAGAAARPGRLTRFRFSALLDSLRSCVEKMRWKPAGTSWADYYGDTNYSPKALAHKERLVARFLDMLRPNVVWDLGANTGLFSRVAARRGITTISFDSDPAAVEKNYLQCSREREKSLLPLFLDLTNPSPSAGWANEERMSLLDRGPADTVMALALLHHLAIGNNTPFAMIARFLARAGRSLIIEFVPKDDSNAQRLLASRRDIFPDYTERQFETEFARHFDLAAKERLADSGRVIYAMKVKA